MNRLLPATLLTLLAACGSGDGGDGPSGDAKASWKLALKIDGADVALPLESMGVFLVKDGYQEIYEIEGPGVELYGVFPKGVSVGYGEKWEVLFGKTIEISPRGGHREDHDSRIGFPDKPHWRVAGGSLVFEKLSGKFAGSKGDRTLHGKVKLRVDTGAGEQTIEGTIAVQAVTWG